MSEKVSEGPVLFPSRSSRFLSLFFLSVSLALFRTMSSLVDSVAEFKSRAQQLLGEDDAQKLLTNDIKSFGELAYSVADQPDRISDARFDEIVKKVFPADVSLGTKAAVRRLAFESLTFSIQDLKMRMEGDSVASKTLPLHEREERRAKQVARLRGVVIEGDHDPANSLVDKAALMLQDGMVRYIPPSQCVSRDAEIASVRRDKEFFSLESGEITLKKKEHSVHVEIGNELSLTQAFVRRGLALDRVGLLDFTIHERLVRQYFSVLNRPAPPAKGAGDMLARRPCRQGALDDHLPTVSGWM